MLSPIINTETTTREPLSLTLAERRICNADFEGSIPFRGSKEFDAGYNQRQMAALITLADVGSSPTPATKHEVPAFGLLSAIVGNTRPDQRSQRA